MAAEQERLAIEGGAPVRPETFGAVYEYGDDDIRELIDVITSRVLSDSRGSKVRRLEEEFATLLGVKHAIACTSGTAAVHIAVGMLNLNPYDQVISGAVGDIGTLVGAIFQNLIPVFADIDPETLTLDPESAESKITNRTRALIAVHFLGEPCAMDEILDIARRHNLFVIEDCAQAMLSEYHGHYVGTIGDIGCFSLGNKLISLGQGGMVVTNDDALAERGRLFGDVARGGRYPSLFLGNNYLMSDLQAAVGIAQLKKAPGYAKRQAGAADLLRVEISDIRGVELLPLRPETKPNRLWFPIRITTELKVTPGGFAHALEYEGIANIFPYDVVPFYKHALFLEKNTYGTSGYPFAGSENGAPVDYDQVSCTATEAMLQNTIIIRMKQSFTTQDVQSIATAIRKVAAHYQA